MEKDEKGAIWYKGNLHTHTTRSDGRKSPEEVMALYRDHGYDFLALTDHWIPSEEGERDGLLLVPGCEYDMGGCAQEGIFHIVGVGMRERPDLQRTSSLRPQAVIDAVNRCGGLAVLAHPAWSMNRTADVLPLRGLAGTEIYNSVSGAPWNARPYSGGFVDQMALEGALLPCFAADDAHFYNGDALLSYIMVKASERTVPSILAAIRRGDFYATQGPRFSLTLEDGLLTVTCSPVSSVIFFSDLVYAPDRVTTGDGITRAVYQIKPGEHFLRVELQDAQGRSAWSSPLALAE